MSKSKVILQTYDENGKPSSTFFEDGMDIINFAEKVDYEQLYERALGEIKELTEGRDALLAHIDDLYFEIEALKNQLDRTRMDNIGMAYQLGGPR